MKADIKKIASELGYTEVTSEIQKKNDTVAFMNKDGAKLMIYYKSGYIRKQYSERQYYFSGHPLIYQLNPTRKNGRFTERVLFPNNPEILEHHFIRHLKNNI